jgi:hypothetical protein
VVNIEFDETTCITAGQLRALGWPLPETIPDVGWIPLASIKTTFRVDRTTNPMATGMLRGEIVHEFTEPFRWVDASVMWSERP